MRDNLHEDLFADHAWQEMHKLLDREMPERKRRGAFWLWFLPALGLCVLLGRDTLLEGKIPVADEKPQQNQPVIAQGKKHTVQPVDKHSKTSPEEPTSASVQQVAGKTEAIAPLAPARGSEKSQKPGRDKLNADKQKFQDHHVLAEQSPSSGDLPPANVSKNEAIPSVTHDEEEVKIFSLNSEEPTHPSNDETTVERLSPTEALATRQSHFNPRLAELEKVSVKPQRGGQKLEWWAEAGTQFASGIKGLSGYKAGILSGVAIGRRRILTGVSYEMAEVGIQSIQRDLLTGQENIGGIKVAIADRTSVTIGQNSGEPVSSIQLQFVNLNLSLYHPIGKRFGVALGGNLHYLGGIKLGDQYLRSTLFDNAVDSVQFSTSAGNLFQPQTDNLSKNSFRAFGFSVQGAVSYRIATRWSASLGYRQSLQHFTKTSDLLLKPSWVDLGVRYRIK